MDDAKPVACPDCGAPLPPGEGLRKVQCTFCGYHDDHPVPLVAGTEVLVKGGLAYELARVSRCEGPDRVHVVPEKGSAKWVPLANLVPVTSDGLQSNMRVYARLFHGWQLTWAEKASASSVVVKSTSEGFQSDFFNETVARHDVRIPLRPEQRERRTFVQQWWIEHRGACLTGIGLVLVLAILVIAVRC